MPQNSPEAATKCFCSVLSWGCFRLVLLADASAWPSLSLGSRWTGRRAMFFWGGMLFVSMSREESLEERYYTAEVKEEKR